MKCALEIVTMTEIAKENKRKEEEAKDLACALAHQKAFEDSIKFCEEVISPFFENNALKGEIKEYTITGVYREDRLGNKHWHPLKYDEDYQYSSTSMKISKVPNYSIAYDIETISQYLKQFCYKVIITTDFYNRYGWGTCQGTKIIIAIDTPQCLN